MTANHILYTTALQADADYSAVVSARTGRTRWTMTWADRLLADVQAAYRAKLTADAVWLAWMRHHGADRDSTT